MTQSIEPVSDPFASVLAELQAPIVAIQGNVRSLMARDESMTAEARQQLHQQVLQHSQRLDTLVDDIVLYLRLLVGPVELAPEPVNVHDVVEELKERLGEPERVTNRVPRQFVLQIDRYALGGALRHLLRNALVYGARERAVVVGVRRVDGTLELTVSDEGFGIPEAGRARAFEPFVRAVHPEEKRNSGAGLGLTVCRELVRLLGGDVELRPNAPGLSATIVLPGQS
jgi:two-component system, OmpR family, sensor histidine kinase SenX3